MSSTRKGVPQLRLDPIRRFAANSGRHLGSSRFILIQTAVLVLWIVWNLALQLHYNANHPGCLRIVDGIPQFSGAARCQTFWKPFDPYPMGLLTLALSVQAASCVPLILLSQNSQRDRDAVNLSSDRNTQSRSDEMQRYLLTQTRQVLETVGDMPTRGEISRAVAELKDAAREARRSRQAKDRARGATE